MIKNAPYEAKVSNENIEQVIHRGNILELVESVSCNNHSQA